MIKSLSPNILVAYLNNRTPHEVAVESEIAIEKSPSRLGAWRAKAAEQSADERLTDDEKARLLECQRRLDAVKDEMRRRGLLGEDE